uniref:Uncharacterized protein n=1 Tax=Arundo donax TaxID=35708 RepID=A0A0A9SGQ8_ARUDO
MIDRYLGLYANVNDPVVSSSHKATSGTGTSSEI